MSTSINNFWPTALLRGEALGGVEPDVLAVEIGVPDDGFDEEGELVRPAHALREDDRGQERVEDRGRRVEHDVGTHGARRNAAHSYSESSEVARQWQGHPQNGRLRSGVRDLTYLSVVGGDGSSVDDHTTLSVAVRLVRGDGCGGKSCDIECPKGILGDGVDESVHVVRASIATDRAGWPTPPPATLITIESVPTDRAALIASATSLSSLTTHSDGTITQLRHEFPCTLTVAVKDGNTDAKPHEVPNSRPAQPTGAPGHDG